MDFDWKSLVKNIAPTIGTALGGPMAGTAVKFVANKLLGNENATEQDVVQYLQTASPEQLVTLKKLDLEFKAKMKELEIDVFRLETQDRQSARDMAKVNMLPQIILSALFVLGYFIILGLMVSGKITIDAAIKDMLLLLIGLITREVPTIMQFWFGSSFGSKAKDVKMGAKL